MEPIFSGDDEEGSIGETFDKPADFWEYAYVGVGRATASPREDGSQNRLVAYAEVADLNDPA